MPADSLFPEFSAARRIGAILAKLPRSQQVSVVRWINERFPEERRVISAFTNPNAGKTDDVGLHVRTFANPALDEAVAP